jgi:hypothetical protein
MISNEEAVRLIVTTAVESFAASFKGRHQAERENPNGTLNMKIHNAFIAALGPEIQYYTALVRSLDSSLGNMLESMAVKIAEINYEVHKNVAGPLSVAQTQLIAELLEKYKRREVAPSVKDYQALRDKPPVNEAVVRRHDSDYYLIDKTMHTHYLIELKIGGDLDNKKARSEKEAILEQYAILSNTLEDNAQLNVHFATAYNRFGDESPWTQERVRQFFADEELLIGRDFWNFITKLQDGYGLVMDSYKQSAHHIKDALEDIRLLYLGK